MFGWLVEGVSKKCVKKLKSVLKSFKESHALPTELGQKSFKKGGVVQEGWE